MNLSAHGGVDETGRDYGHPDSVMFEPDGERFGEHFQAGFAAGIGRRHGQGDGISDRTHQNNMPTPARGHAFRYGVCPYDRRGEIHCRHIQ